MTERQLVSSLHSGLVDSIKAAVPCSEKHAIAFAARVLGKEFTCALPALSLGSVESDYTPYGGYPALAALGFAIAGGGTGTSEPATLFLNGMRRLMDRRPESSVRPLSIDDVAVLGIADGLAALADVPERQSDVGRCRQWLVSALDSPPPQRQWSFRMRDLAGDLLDDRGRLRADPSDADTNARALEVALRSVWPQAFASSAAQDRSELMCTLSQLLLGQAPERNAITEAAVWLRALSVLVSRVSNALLPSTSDLAQVLARTQGALKRWVAESADGHKQPAMWLIDREAHVQSFLWAVLYPIFRDDLVDEIYLPSWGAVQPRFDLGVRSLKVIIEVKYARHANDIRREIEEQIGNDLGLYFKDTSQFDRMIVYVYDDCEQHLPERYDGLRNALMQRDRVEDVIIVRRPSMMPSRTERKTSQ